MATSSNPPVVQTPNLGISGVLLSTALTANKALEGTDAVGTALALVFTAGAQGSRLDANQLRFTQATTNAATSGTSSALVARAWINNGSANTVNTNNQFWDEVAIPATTVVAGAATTALPVYSFKSFPVLPAGYKIYVGLTVAVGGTNLALQPMFNGGDF
jgi:hypothetical protein